MQTLSDNFESILSVRHRIAALLAFALVLMTSILALAIWLEQRDPSALRGSMAALKAVLESLLGAIFVTLGIYLFGFLSSLSSRSRFRGLFGIKERAGDVILVLPRYTVESIGNAPQTDPCNSSTLKRIDDANESVLHIDDIIACRHVTAMFAEAGFHTPQIYFDDDVHKVLFGVSDLPEKKTKAIRSARTLVVIGMFSNCVSTEINRRSLEKEKRSFRFSIDLVDDVQDRRIEIASHSDRTDSDIHKWREQSAKWKSFRNDEDFGLIAKCFMPGDRTAIIVAGETARATRKSASYFRDHWQRVWKLDVGPSGSQIKSKPFSVLLSVSHLENSRPKRIDAFCP